MRGKRTTYTPNKFDKWSGEFWAMPSKDKPATTTQASVRNFVHNVASLPREVKRVAKSVAEFHATRGVPRRKMRGKRMK